PSNTRCVHIFGSRRSTSSHCGCVSVGSTPKPNNSLLRGRPAGAKFHSSSAEDVQSAYMLCNAKRMIDLKRHMHDRVTEPDTLGHHRRGCQKLLRTGQMRVAR